MVVEVGALLPTEGVCVSRGWMSRFLFLPGERPVAEDQGAEAGRSHPWNNVRGWRLGVPSTAWEITSRAEIKSRTPLD